MTVDGEDEEDDKYSSGIPDGSCKEGLDEMDVEKEEDPETVEDA